MAVTGPATPLSAVLSQIQAPLRTNAATAATPAQEAQPATTARQAAKVPPTAVSANGEGQLNPNAPRGTYLNLVV